ncbi:hypothetical protein BKA61DRAFT_692647 [Leptodontidium sp. MPI-SDFR-AT-0119]|nr:hypothetical protein BKA61DRAFT_692647 [Leptodontidium sp. MPI-SDFR-AT-0119]
MGGDDNTSPDMSRPPTVNVYSPMVSIKSKENSGSVDQGDELPTNVEAVPGNIESADLDHEATNDPVTALHNAMAESRKKHKQRGRAGSDGGPFSSQSTSSSSKKGKEKVRAVHVPQSGGDLLISNFPSGPEPRDRPRLERRVLDESGFYSEEVYDEDEEVDEQYFYPLARVWSRIQHPSDVPSGESSRAGEKNNWESDGPPRRRVSWGDVPSPRRQNRETDTTNSQTAPRRSSAPSLPYEETATDDLVQKLPPGDEPTTPGGRPFVGIGSELALAHRPRRGSIISREVAPEHVVVPIDQVPIPQIGEGSLNQQNGDDMPEVGYDEDVSSTHDSESTVTEKTERAGRIRGLGRRMKSKIFRRNSK